jgi:hypothetical protein
MEPNMRGGLVFLPTSTTFGASATGADESEYGARFPGAEMYQFGAILPGAESLADFIFFTFLSDFIETAYSVYSNEKGKYELSTMAPTLSKLFFICLFLSLKHYNNSISNFADH